jgi:hypothetical protein
MERKAKGKAGKGRKKGTGMGKVKSEKFRIGCKMEGRTRMAPHRT